MRRGVANWIIDSGASVAELKEWIGWRDTRTAMRYLDGTSSLPSKIIERKLQTESFLGDTSSKRLSSSEDYSVGVPHNTCKNLT